MIEFKQNVEGVLPYDRRQYIEFLDNDFEGANGWYGVSFQLNFDRPTEINFTKYVEVYDLLFKKIIIKLDNGSFWIVNHDDKDLKWFPNDDDNLYSLHPLI